MVVVKHLSAYICILLSIIYVFSSQRVYVYTSATGEKQIVDVDYEKYHINIIKPTHMV